MSLDRYKDPITTHGNIDELHHVLVQTCLDYMKNYSLTDIDEIQFCATGLSESYKYNEWTPATDSSLLVIGLQEEVGKNHLVRKIIGDSM